MTKEELHQRIHSAFAAVPYPGDDKLGSPNGRDDAEKVDKFFRGKSWQSLKSNELHGSGLYFMTAEAFHYYLPAYLLAWDDEEAVDVIDSVIAHLTPPELDENEMMGFFFHENFRNFTPDQKKAIGQFLDYVHMEVQEWYSDMGGLSEKYNLSTLALRDYWRKF